jgi:hypothetical protein
MRRNLVAVAAVLELLVASTSAFASWVHIDENGLMWECWYVQNPDEGPESPPPDAEVRCMLLDHMLPIEP